MTDATSDSGAASTGVFGRLRSRFVPRSADALEAQDLRSTAALSGATPIADCVAGEQVAVCGTIRSLTLRPRGGVTALEAELYDGSDRILLIWLGRRRIHGIDPGRGLLARGRATAGRDSLVVYNPGYELRASGPE